MIRPLAHALVIVSALVSPANAIPELTPEPGWTYRVTGVATGDRLNVREQPGAGSAIVGTLPSNGTDVIVTGVRTEMAGSVWWRIRAAGSDGWVNARYLTPSDTGAEKATGFPLACSGTEPFWALVTGPEGATFSTPDSDERWVAGEPRAPAGAGHVAVRLAHGGQVGHLAAFRTYAFCSDGMSDLQYPFEAILVAPDGRVLSGCCARGG